MEDVLEECLDLSVAVQHRGLDGVLAEDGEAGINEGLHLGVQRDLADQRALILLAHLLGST